jgi:hypothetical protein
MEWGLCISVTEDSILLGDDAVSVGTQFPVFCGNKSTFQRTAGHPKLRMTIFLDGEKAKRLNL